MARKIDDEAVLDLYRQGYNQKQIAKTLGHNLNTVGYHLRANGVASSRIKMNYKKIRELNEAGKTKKEIAEILGYKIGSLDGAMKRGDIEYWNKRSLPFEKEILDLYSQNLTSREIASSIGESVSAVNKVLFKNNLAPNLKGKRKYVVVTIKTIDENGIKREEKKNISVEEIIALKKSGKSNKEIEKFYNFTISYRVIGLVLNEAGIFSNLKKSSFTDEEVLQLHNEGKYDKEIADILGVSRSAITQRLNRLGLRGRQDKMKDTRLRSRISKSLIGRFTGENNANYKGGVVNLRKQARGILKTFTNRVLRERGYKCAFCGDTKGTKNVHHIKPFKEIFQNFLDTTYSGNPETFYDEIMAYEPFTDESNLIVLCEKCHKNLHRKSCAKPESREGATTIESASENEDK